MNDTIDRACSATVPLTIARPLGDLWSEHAGDLRRLCRARAGAELADEALSRVSLAAHVYFLRAGGVVEQPRAWLMTIARNVCSDLHREQKRNTVETVDDDTLERLAGSAAVAADFGNPERRLLRRERIRQATAAIAALPPHLRTPLLLAREHGSAAIAAALGLTRENVRKRIQVAREQVRRSLIRRS